MAQIRRQSLSESVFHSVFHPWLPPLPPLRESPFQFGPILYPRAVVSAVPNPALDAFVAHLATEFPFGEVLLRRIDDGFRMSHVEDRDAANLRESKATELRDLAQFTA